MEIVTGSTGVAHVIPIDDAVRNSNFGYYTEKIVFDVFRAFEAVAVTANEVRVYSGYGMNQGRLFKIDDSDYDSVTIENGTQGVKRADLIVARYTMDSQTGFEDISLAVIKGQSGQTYTDPSHTEGNINEGASLDEFPLYRVKVNGIVIEAVEPLFEATPDGGRLGVLEKRLDGQMLVDLARTSRNSLDGSENVDLGVKGNLPIANGGTGSSTVAGARNNLGLGNTDGALPVANGGTGKTSFTSGRVLVGNGTEPISEKAIDSTVTAESENLITSGAVAQALEEGGYGDMLKSTYVVSSSVDAIKPSKGGTGKTSWTQGTVLVGNGQSTPTERSIDTTSGGTAGSDALITSGAVKSKIAEMQATFQSGVDTIVDAIKRNGVTPSASTPSACADGIDDVATNKYNAGYKAQHIIRIILATFLSSRNEEGGFTINRSNLNVSKIVFVGAETSSTVRVILRGNSGSQELKNSTGVSNGETYNISNYSASTYPNLAIQHYAGSNPNLAVDLYVDF